MFMKRFSFETVRNDLTAVEQVNNASEINSANED